MINSSAIKNNKKTRLMEESCYDTVLYTPQDIKNIFHIGINQAYALMNSSCFPSFKINKKLLVSKNTLDEWLEKNKGKNIKI